MSSQKLDSELVWNSPQFKRWKSLVLKNGAKLQDLEVLSFVSRDQKNLYCALLDGQLVTPEGLQIPRCIVLRGNSVVVIPILHCINDGEIYTLTVEQHRIANGNLVREFPGGGVDSLNNPVDAAHNEVYEELGLDIPLNELIPLTDQPIQVCSGLLDESTHYFYFEKQVDRSFLEKIEGKSMGCHDEHEFIWIRVQKMEEVRNHRTTPSLVGLQLIEQKLGRIF